MQQEFYYRFTYDLAELTRCINIDDFSFILTSLNLATKGTDLNSVNHELSIIDSKIKLSYNTFMLKYGHIESPRHYKCEFEKEYKSLSDFLRSGISSIQQIIGSVVNQSRHKDISSQLDDCSNFLCDNDKIQKEIKKLCEVFEQKCKEHNLKLIEYAEKWKKEQWEMLEQYRLLYVQT